MANVNVYPYELPDTLSLGKAIRMAMKNSDTSLRDTFLLAIYETELITGLSSRYYPVPQIFRLIRRCANFNRT